MKGLASSLCTCMLLVRCQPFPKHHVVGASRLGRLGTLSGLLQSLLVPCKETGRPISRLPGSATKRPLLRAEPQEAAAKNLHRGSRNTFEFSAMHFDAVSDPRHTGPTTFINIRYSSDFCDSPLTFTILQARPTLCMMPYYHTKVVQKPHFTYKKPVWPALTSRYQKHRIVPNVFYADAAS